MKTLEVVGMAVTKVLPARVRVKGMEKCIFSRVWSWELFDVMRFGRRTEADCAV